MLELRDIAKSFGGLQAVRGCSFPVEQGTITGLIGPNGAGKTTIFNLIGGAQRPDSGTIVYRGDRIDGLRPDQVFRRGIFRTFQTPREFATMTVLENLMVIPQNQTGESVWGRWVRGRRVAAQERELEDRARAALEFLQLSHVARDYAATLSGGQKKLLELARAVMAEAQLVLLDEPGAGVNPTLMRQVVARIQAMAAAGVTFLLIEHDMPLVMELCHPIIVVSEGRHLMQGTAAEVQSHPAVLEAYLGGQYAGAAQ